MKLFVLSDIHSFYTPMMEALEANGFDRSDKNHIVVICGDLFDRGPDAKKCFEFVKEMNEQHRLIYVYGNHEELLYDCVHQAAAGNGISKHHITNGTVDTIAQLTDIPQVDLINGWANPQKVISEMLPVLQFITDNTYDYAEIGEYIFVHGWIPLKAMDDKPAYYVRDRKFCRHPDWRNATLEEWSQARWLNGMDMWRSFGPEENKTVVVGHWHCSWGHSHLTQDRKEFPQKNRADWYKSFVPFRGEGIIAIDSCVSYTGFCNCIVLDVDVQSLDEAEKGEQ